MPTFIKDLFDLPDVVRGGDFVLRLAESLERPEQTLRDYVVTPQLAKCFDEALSLVRDALEGRTSKACYLLGSFGSGKSHFMAVLNLLLKQNPTAREIAQLADVVTKHNVCTSGKRFMLVPFNLIGATGLEAALLGGYADHVRRDYPDAPTPPVYRAEALFDDAKGLREAMGDKAFFTKLNRENDRGTGGAAPAAAGWGDLEGGWDAKRFERALAAAANNADRRQLVTDLVETFFRAAQNNSEFVGLDDVGLLRIVGLAALDIRLELVSQEPRKSAVTVEEEAGSICFGVVVGEQTQHKNIVEAVIGVEARSIGDVYVTLGRTGGK